MPTPGWGGKWWILVHRDKRHRDAYKDVLAQPEEKAIGSTMSRERALPFKGLALNWMERRKWSVGKEFRVGNSLPQ